MPHRHYQPHPTHQRPRPKNQFPFTTKTGGPELTMMSTADDALETVRIMDAYVKAPLSNMTIADAYACLGGNTSAFSHAFKSVRAYEIDPVRREQLEFNIRHKIGGYYANDNVTVYADCTDAQEGIAATPQDVVFLDPPWWCADHKTVDACMFAGLAATCRDLAASTSFVFMKLPSAQNYPGLRPDLDQLQTEMKAEWADVESHPITRANPRSSYQIICARNARPPQGPPASPPELIGLLARLRLVTLTCAPLTPPQTARPCASATPSAPGARGGTAAAR
jgi:16S rRNA G966 N2-methylase RsmD